MSFFFFFFPLCSFAFITSAEMVLAVQVRKPDWTSWFFCWAPSWKSLSRFSIDKSVTKGIQSRGIGGNRTMQSLGLEPQRKLTNVDMVLDELLLLSWPGSFTWGLSICGCPQSHVTNQLFILSLLWRLFKRILHSIFFSPFLCTALFDLEEFRVSTGARKRAYKNAFIVNL